MTQTPDQVIAAADAEIAAASQRRAVAKAAGDVQGQRDAYKREVTAAQEAHAAQVRSIWGNRRRK